ncbi:hypothetical protein DEU56DRAFT_753291 [Suillus clintonianus]|uniref:uncharacterized protein n=1 Tax=Suillus clintonianus TaxID=1904413 RepID=UPI001B86ADE2|nr:uncharacterized protein DEU56DRAFT_753291 [Suillus clintonianus]KAG2148038.1 hypothetical protein DEU56DRAFT_753291 [Suillus clintonianus]
MVQHFFEGQPIECLIAAIISLSARQTARNFGLLGGELARASRYLRYTATQQGPNFPPSPQSLPATNPSQSRIYAPNLALFRLAHILGNTMASTVRTTHLDLHLGLGISSSDGKHDLQPPCPDARPYPVQGSIRGGSHTSAYSTTAEEESM